jgi:TRAP-type C4-dicarboxylate transport system substrate-binding protein
MPIKYLLAFSLAVEIIAAPIPLKLATAAPKGTSLHQALLEMRQKWLQAPGGGAILTIYPTGVQGGEADVVRRMNNGQIQSAMLTVVGLSEIDASVSALQYMPMMFRNLEEVDYVRDRVAPTLEKRLLAKNFVVLFWGDAGWVRFFSKEPARLPADFKKMKMFTWAGDAYQADLMKTAGYQPVPLEINDIYMGLQNGMINAVAQPPFWALAGQMYRPAPYMLEVNWAPLVGATVITKKSWDAIPAETREAMLKAAKEAGAQIKTRSRAESDESVAAMKKLGLKVQAASPEIDAEWRKVAEEFYPKIRGKIVPADIFDEVTRLLQEYRRGKP